MKKWDDMFFWCGICLFDSKLEKYGGFNHFIAGKIFRWKYAYVSIELRRAWSFDKSYQETYYDGYHNYWNFTIIRICYGT